MMRNRTARGKGQSNVCVHQNQESNTNTFHRCREANSVSVPSQLVGPTGTIDSVILGGGL